MNNNKKHRTPGPLGSNPADLRQQRGRGPLGLKFDIHGVAASTPGPSGLSEGVVRHMKEAEARLNELKVQLYPLTQKLRKEGVAWAKDTAIDVAFDQMKDKGMDVLKGLVGKTAGAAMFMTDWVVKIVEVNQKMSEEWVQAKDPSVKRLEIKGGAPTAAAMEKVLKDGGMVFEGQGGLYWSKDPNYQPKSASTFSVRANPLNKSDPKMDKGNGLRDDRPESFGRTVFLVATMELAFDKALDTLVDEGAKSPSPISQWAKKTALQIEKKLVTDKYDQLLMKVAAQKGPIQPSAPPKPGPPPANTPAGAAKAAITIQEGKGVKQVTGLDEGDYVIKPNK